MTEGKIRCECLERVVHENARIDLWHAAEKGSYWVEVTIGADRIYQSLGFGKPDLAETEFRRQLRSLPERMQAWIAQQAESDGAQN